MGLSPIRVVRSERAADEFFQCYQMPPCPTIPRRGRRKTSIAMMIPASSPAAPRWPSTTAFRASCLKSASDRKSLLVGFSHDRRFFVQLLVLLVFFVLVIIVGMSRRHRVTARAGGRSQDHTSELQSLRHLVCRL